MLEIASSPTSFSQRILAIGDIHGQKNELIRVLNEIEPGPEDTIVTLGDYVDHGPDSKGVIDTLIELKSRCHLVSILGNHDEMMLQARGDINALYGWREQGGYETLFSYSDHGDINRIPDSHWRFLEACVPYYETDEFIFVHANYHWACAMRDQPIEFLRWHKIEDQAPKQHHSGKKVICGHSPGLVRDLGFCLCVDTGCGYGGYLSWVELASSH